MALAVDSTLGLEEARRWAPGEDSQSDQEGAYLSVREEVSQLDLPVVCP